ncbi:MAG: hypothetical protein F6K47_09085 [Symploca sp. SIO2E6]|nr:hypothetical protein [Symploca sp. SIO2E6]
MENGELGIGNWELGIGNWELRIGNCIILLPPVPLQGGVRGGLEPYCHQSVSVFSRT